MDVREYERMARAEEGHWWYVGLHDLVARLARRLGLPAGARALDAGCGTGGALARLHGMLGFSYAAGFDTHPPALARARQRLRDAEFYQSDICDPEIRGAPFDLILCLDVVYIPGAERARSGLERLAAALRPGGLFVLHVPAYNWLKSEHDLAVATHERYTALSVRDILARMDLEPALVSYRVCLAFPLVVATRLPGIVRVRFLGGAKARSALESPLPTWLSRALLSTLLLENRWLEKGRRLPWGSSVIGVGRRR